MSDDDTPGFEVARITIVRVINDADDDTKDVIYTTRDGDAETNLVTALGMLAMATDDVLHAACDDE